MELYGLYSEKTGQLMAWEAYSNGDDDAFCVDVAYRLRGITTLRSLTKLWVTHDKICAEEVCKRGSETWYNADYSTPEWDEERHGDLKVVCLNDGEK